MNGDYVKIDKGEIDFNYIYTSSQIPNGDGYPVNALPQWWDDVDPVAGTLYMDPNNGLVYEVQADGRPVAMGFLGEENYNQIMDRVNPEPTPTPEPQPEPGPGPNPNPEPNPEPTPNPTPNPTPTPGPRPGPAPVERDGYEYGYYGEGIAGLVEVIASSCQGVASYSTENTGTIKTTAQEYWEGLAEQRFEEVVDLDAAMFSEKVSELFNAAITEINNAGVSDQNFDKSLMENVS